MKVTDFISQPANPLASERNRRLEEFDEALLQSREELEENLEKIKAAKSESVTEAAPKSEPAPKEDKAGKIPQLVYFSFPTFDYDAAPLWVNPLQETMQTAGYLIFNPWQQVQEQYTRQDVTQLNACARRLVPQLASILQIPQEVLLPFEHVEQTMQRSEAFDNEALVFKNLWFLARSSLIILDLDRPMTGAGTAHELLYAKQLGIPVIGLMPKSGRLSPWVQRSVTMLFTDSNLAMLLPAIRGYAPL